MWKVMPYFSEISTIFGMSEAGERVLDETREAVEQRRDAQPDND